MKWEYRIEKFKMPSDWADGRELERKWYEMASEHWVELNKLGQEGWECYLNIGPLFYFKRP